MFKWYNLYYVTFSYKILLFTPNCQACVCQSILSHVHLYQMSSNLTQRFISTKLGISKKISTRSPACEVLCLLEKELYGKLHLKQFHTHDSL